MTRNKKTDLSALLKRPSSFAALNDPCDEERTVESGRTIEEAHSPIVTQIMLGKVVQQNTQRVDLSALLKVMPPFVARNHPQIKEWTGYSGRTIANLDALKPPKGPSKRIMLGNTVAYPRESLVEWLESRSRIIS